ncbi:hypothetical protein EF989_24140 [Salmonella enterica]|uniref:Uncharacterized protein n=7 Tax=Salmonella enterica TaxID=28901 RepID=A0A5Z3C8Y3_SALER|nr:hypothetical protein SEEA1960_004835 [Salmonella enterica subsp. enterica serovar Albany str. ATCC 51960]AWD11381.1 hypothetical protein C7D56_14575 [Salmonella enterica subsp. enterica serovar Corvallis]AXD26784.1 hypothetical protein CHE86_04865 [Salmonella enterica]EAA1045577.1 hypothetical protein [Salmonella enterica subsp. enterica serovar Westeinde]EAA1506805.1 hypothetical protein [Salmonella enterica subsp. enterica serovar Agama]EAA4030727.1 hypothetical protein [Salmonella enteri
MVSANASTRSTFGSSFNALRSSWDISSSLFALPDGVCLSGLHRRHPAIQVIPRNHARDRAPGE